MDRKILGITMGDPAGIGAEITAKALQSRNIYDLCRPVVIGDLYAIKDAAAFTQSDLHINVIESARDAKGEPGALDLIDLGLLKEGGWKYGQVQSLCGECAYQYVETAIRLAMAGDIDGVVTGPLNKEALHLAGHNYAGHTEIFADLTGTKDYAMLLVGGGLRVIHVTTHLALRQACERIKKARVLRVIELAASTLARMNLPVKIAVAGLNPHASENGLFGSEEENEIIPAINEARARGIDAVGPVPPDTVFVKARAGEYSMVVAMYHDQGHIPVKLAGFAMDKATGLFTSMSGVNCTVGLPIVRSSVDHGTAFDRAGQNRSNEQSMIDAIEVAVQLAGGGNG